MWSLAGGVLHNNTRIDDLSDDGTCVEVQRKINVDLVRLTQKETS